MEAPLVLELDRILPADLPRVGGKALQLGRLARAGFPVPSGYVVTTEACRAWEQPETRTRVVEAYRKLGAGPVAVRSSATTEDLEDASFAGQQETYLDVEGVEALVTAVSRCRDSLQSERAAAYRKVQGIPESAAEMAVVVQRMVPAEAAGVLFTRDPTASGSGRMLVEAVRGLGEALVSGRAAPDRWALEAVTGRVLHFNPAGEAPPVLTAGQLADLAQLGRRIEAEFDAPQDVEWAAAGGVLFVLQSRPITADAGAREGARRAEIARLRDRAEPDGTVWSRYSLAETLPEPLPLTWALWRQFMTGAGGYGRMYRELGFDPDPALDQDGVLELIAGRPYFNLSRDARLYFRGFPNDYPFEKLKADPERAIYPRPEPNLAKAPPGFLPRLPGLMLRMLRAERTLESAAEAVPRDLIERVFPRMERLARELRETHLDRLGPSELLAAIQETRAALFDTFLPEALKPGVLAGIALQKLEAELQRKHGEAAVLLAGQALSGAAPRPEWDLTRGLRDLVAGRMASGEFLERFGHRGPGEMELSSPRWRELGAAALPSGGMLEGDPMTPVALPPGKAGLYAERARAFTALREAARHHLMLGYEGLRRLLLELDRRAGLDGRVFYLEPEELPRLAAGEDFGAVIAARRKQRAMLLGLEAPRVLFSDDLEAIGRPTAPPSGGDDFRGTGVSPGAAEGRALVLQSPAGAPDAAQGFILVCPSTDPGWVPLFLRARGLVMETGGVLSHGAIVAREFGLPAVANVPHACARFRDGDRLRVDGTSGQVWRVAD